MDMKILLTNLTIYQQRRHFGWIPESLSFVSWIQRMEKEKLCIIKEWLTKKDTPWDPSTAKCKALGSRLFFLVFHFSSHAPSRRVVYILPSLLIRI